MAIASCSVKIISRSKGRSAVAAAAYRSGQTLQNESEGLSYSYPRKRGIVYEAILAPAHAPDWAQDRQQLWNRVEQTERRKDARLAREIMVALPRELSAEQNIEVARAYALTFVRQGMIADVTVHDTGDGNPHSHIMLTTRPLDGGGFSKKKNSSWDSRERLIEWRKEYETITNGYLERYGHEQRIDVRSYEEQGVDKLPSVHLGYYAHQLERKGIQTDRGNINRQIAEASREIENINSEIAHLKQEAEYVKSIQGTAGYPAEKWQDKPFYHNMAGEYIRKYDIPDATVSPHSMEEEDLVEVEEPSGDSPVDDLIEHYTRMLEDVKKTAETAGIVLTEKGKQSLILQQRNIENAIEQLRQQQEQKLKEHPAPVHQSGDAPMERGKNLTLAILIPASCRD